MDVFAVILLLILYMGLSACAVDASRDLGLLKRDSREATFVVRFAAGVFWPVFILVGLFYVGVGLVWVCRNAGDGFRFFGRGVRDLLPKRKVKLPKARVL